MFKVNITNLLIISGALNIIFLIALISNKRDKKRLSDLYNEEIKGKQNLYVVIENLKIRRYEFIRKLSELPEFIDIPAKDLEEYVNKKIDFQRIEEKIKL